MFYLKNIKEHHLQNKFINLVTEILIIKNFKNGLNMLKTVYVYFFVKENNMKHFFNSIN